MLLVGEDTGRLHGCYGNPAAHTPHIDRLAETGCRFTNGFSHAPVCAPSRGGLVAGRYAHSLGNFHMRCRLAQPPRLFTHDLQDAGYHVAWPTKTDFNFEPPEDFATTTEDWMETLGQQPPDEPWFLFRNFSMTHESGVWDRPNWSGDTYQTRVADLPEHLRIDPANVHVPAYLPDTPEVRRDIARNLDMLASQDHQVGQCLAALEQSGMADHTVVIYTSDHGRGLPREKRWCYDAGVHLPLVIRMPPGMKTPGYQAGGVNDQLVAWIDFAPTILSLCGIDKPERMEGRVFLGAQREAARDFVFGGRDRMDECYDRTRYCRSHRYHYIRNHHPDIPWMQGSWYMDQGPTAQKLRELRRAGKLEGVQAQWMSEAKPAEELYDVVNDPENVRNLADEPAYAAVLDRHRAAMDAWQAQYDTLADLSEEELIERGVLTDDLQQYRDRVKPQAPEDQLGPREVSVTLREHRQRQKQAD